MPNKSVSLIISTDHLDSSVTECLSDSKEWISFVLSSVVTFFGGIILLLITAIFRTMLLVGFATKTYKLFGRTFKFKWLKTCETTLPGNSLLGEVKDSHVKPRKQDWPTYSREIARELVTAQRQSGRFLATCVLFCSIGSLVMYIIDTYRSKGRACLASPFYKLQLLDQCFNIFFLIFFFIRFIAAYNKLAFWFELSSLVDFFTVPPSFVALFLHRNWLGFRFLRAIRLINIPDLLLYTGVLRSTRTISISRLCANFAAFLICAAGFVHLVENSGDFFLNFKNSRDISFFDCLYFMVVTLTTVGYGDFACVTYTGKAFMMAFLIAGLAFFAMLVPQLNSLFGVDRRFAGAYHAVRGRKHVVVCGELNFRSLSAVIVDFLHPDREESRDIDVCILNTTLPSIELEALMKRHSPFVSYFLGSAMQREHLNRVLMRDADACIILVDRETNLPSETDFANIMRVIAIKNYSPSTKILLQLMHYANKPLVLNIPHWTSSDEIICISEIKLGLLSQSCLAFGFSTMMANIFRVTADEPISRMSSWRDLYCQGASMEIYTCLFSPYFENKTFKDATLVCFKMGILLLAVEQQSKFGNIEIFVNPGSKYIINAKTSRAFVLASSSEESKRIKWLCQHCHIYGQSLIIPRSPCQHFDPEFYSDIMSNKVNDDYTHKQAGKALIQTAYRIISLPYQRSSIVPPNIEIDSSIDIDINNFDASGMYYRCEAKTIEECTLNDSLHTDFVLKHVLRNHIVVCLFANADSPSIGLRSFMLPLRASNLLESELHPVIIIGDLTYLRREWEFLCNFPLIYFYSGSPNSREVMRQIRLNDSHTCIVMSLIDRDNDDNYLIDKSAILCTLCIRSFTCSLSEDNSNCRKEIVESENIRSSMQKVASTIRYPPTVTDLEIEKNVQYVQDDNDDDTRFELYRTHAFASGQAFVDTIIDYIISTAYYNDRALRVIRTLLSGGSATIVDSEMGLPNKGNKNEILRNRCRSRVTLVDFEYLRIKLNMNAKYISFGELFSTAMSKEETLCLGIYRLKFLLDNDRSKLYRRRTISQQARNKLMSFDNRIVVTFPSALMQMHETDQVYVAQQFNPNTWKD
ncbi:hypothetical protein GJ496_001934 [Pomphorhynchus laevis]|nr:hypothetical protein GJ496_001934 [Pomphorhynchus laevis]